MSSLGLSGSRALLLPITGTFVLPFAAYYVYLSMNVVMKRNDNDLWMGDKVAKPDATAVSNTGKKAQHASLYRSIRAQTNFAEYVPLTFLFAAVAELNGADRKVLSSFLGALFLARVAHANFGLLYDETTMANGRPIGFLGTCGLMSGLAGYTAYLVKGFWGF